MDSFKYLSIREIRNNAKQRFFLVENNGCFLEANELTASLLKCLKESSSIDEGIMAFCSANKGLDEDIVRCFVEEQLLNKLTNNAEQVNTFLYQKLLIGPSRIDPIAKKLSFLFNRTVCISCLLLALLLDIIYIILTPNLLRFSSNVDASIIIGVLIFLATSSFVHELGHAAAAYKFGIDTKGIGLGLYINFPVLFTDVTNIWRLPRLQRCVVNIGGIYFQLIIIIPIIFVHQITGIEILRYFVVAANFSFLLNLNPFFKFDGYWLISDMIGVPNLRKKSKEFFKYIVKKVLKQSTVETPYLLQLKGCYRIFILIYAIIVNIFMVYYILYIIPLFIWSFVNTIPDLTKQLIICLSNNIMPPFVLIQNLFSQVLFFLIVIFMLYRLGLSYVNRTFKNNTRT